MGKRIGNIYMDDPMERLLNTVQVITQLQSSLNDSRQTHEAIKENKLTNIHTRWTNLAETVDFQDLDSLNSMRDTLVGQKESYVAENPYYADEIETLWSGLNNSLTKGIQVHTKFDNAYASVENTMKNMEPILQDIISKHGGVIPVDQQEMYLQEVRDSFESLSKNTALLKSYSNRLPEKYTDIYDNLNVANWMQGTLLTQFEEVLDDTEIELIQNGLNGTMNYNELSTKWKMHQGDSLALWRDNKHKYESSIDQRLEDWEILEDFKNRYYIGEGAGGLNTLSTAGEGGEWTPPFPTGGAGGGPSPEEVYIYGPNNKSVYKWNFASNNHSLAETEEAKGEKTIIEQIEAEQNRIKGDILAKDARYFDLQQNVAGISSPMRYNERFEELDGMWPWETTTPGAGGFQTTWTPESGDSWKALTADEKRQYRDLGYDMDTEDWYRTTFDAGNLPAINASTSLTPDLASKIFSAMDPGVQKDWQNSKDSYDVFADLDPIIEYPQGSGNTYKMKEIYDIVIGGEEPTKQKPTQQLTDYLYDGYGDVDKGKINTYFNALNPQTREAHDNSVEKYWESIDDKQRSRILKRNVSSTVRNMNPKIIGPGQFDDYMNWLETDQDKLALKDTSGKVNRGDGKGFQPKKKIWYSDKIYGLLNEVYPDESGFGGSHGYYRTVKSLIEQYYNTDVERNGKTLTRGLAKRDLAKEKLKIIFGGDYTGQFAQTWRPDGWDYEKYGEEKLRKFNE